jgi:hypothetical protein
LKGGNPSCFGRFSGKPFTRTNIHLTNPKRHEFVRTASHWKISLPALKSGKPICLADLGASLLLSIIHLMNPKRHEFGRTAIHWKIFSSSFEKRKPDLLWPI